jgi:membrane fusion protein, multidrug efflux system
MFRTLTGLFILALLPAALASEMPARETDSLTARGLVRAVNEATLSTETSQRILRLPKREAEAFRRGELLVEFDCDRPRAEWKAAEAERMGAQAAFDNSRRLAEYRAAGSHDVQIARASLEKASAALEVIAVRLKHCQLLAPYDGRVLELPVREHEVPQAGQPLMRIVDDASLELDILLPATSLAWLKPGVTFHFQPDSGSKRYEGSVLRLGAAVDPVSQTVRAIGRVDLQRGDLLPGQAGIVSFRRGGA